MYCTFCRKVIQCHFPHVVKGHIDSDGHIAAKKKATKSGDTKTPDTPQSPPLDYQAFVDDFAYAANLACATEGQLSWFRAAVLKHLSIPNMPKPDRCGLQGARPDVEGVRTLGRLF